MNAHLWVKNFAGELLGTFILVLFGCGIITVATLFKTQIGLFHVAVAWGFAVMLGIYCSRHLSDAHLNPAVSIAMVSLQRLPARRLLVYIPAQILGAFLAAAALYLLFAEPIRLFEAVQRIERGSPASLYTAGMFGAYYPNPHFGYGATAATAAIAEGSGGFLLVLVALLIMERRTADLSEYLFSPVFLGVTVTAIVILIAPLSSCAINPARDLGPKLFMYLAGWKTIALPGPEPATVFIYLLAPVAGGLLAALLFSRVIRPMIFSPEGMVYLEKD